MHLVPRVAVAATAAVLTVGGLTAPADAGTRPTPDVPRLAGGMSTRQPVSDILPEPISAAATTPGMPAAKRRPVKAKVAGAHRLIIVPMWWQTRSKPAGQPSTAELAALGKRLDRHWAGMTQGRVRVPSVKVLPWRKVAVKGTRCSFSPSAVMRAAASAAGRFPQDGATHVVAYFPEDGHCGWTGLGTLASDRGYNDVLINGDPGLHTLAHEFGHNLGAHHTGMLVCEDAGGRQVPWAPSCLRDTYTDPWDLMGGGMGGDAGHVGLGQMMRMGLMPKGSVVAVSGTRTVRLAPISASSGVRGATFRVGSKTFYVEFRAPVGVDGWVRKIDAYYGEGGGMALPDGRTEMRPGRGVVVRELDTRAPQGYRAETDAVAFQIDDDGVWPALFAGQRYRAPRGVWSIAVKDLDDRGATVTITAPRA